MKRTIFVIAFLVLLISIPIITEANDTMEFNYTTEMNLPNPALKSEKVELPLYKTLKYEFGYTGAACIAYGALRKSSGLILIITPDLLFNWLNSVNVNIFLPSKSRLAIGVEYGWFPHLKERVGLLLLMGGTDYIEAEKWAIFYKSILLNIL